MPELHDDARDGEDEKHEEDVWVDEPEPVEEAMAPEVGAVQEKGYATWWGR